MQDATGGSQHPPAAGYSLQEAAALLGIGVNTLRRRIAAGQIQAAQVQRPQGYVWRVYLDGQHPPTDPPDDPPIQKATGSLPHPPSSITQAEAMVSLIQTTIGTVLGPLMAEQAALGQTVERQAETIAELREDRGRQAAELERATATIATLGNELAAERAKSIMPTTASQSSPVALEASPASQSAGTAPDTFAGRLRPLTPGLMTTLAVVALVVLTFAALSAGLVWPR
jgi:hypothetical protein